ncbi:MAG: hypothetical protein ACREQ2_14420 [Candidatus Binatia bacterium]
MYQEFFRRTSVRVLILAGILGAAATSEAAAEGTVQKLASTSDGYCHLKIPAMRPSTLATGTPELKSSTTGDLIDFYGPCNYDPRSKDEVAMQKKFRSLKYGKF